MGVEVGVETRFHTFSPSIFHLLVRKTVQSHLEASTHLPISQRRKQKVNSTSRSLRTHTVAASRTGPPQALGLRASVAHQLLPRGCPWSMGQLTARPLRRASWCALDGSCPLADLRVVPSLHRVLFIRRKSLSPARLQGKETPRT